MAESTKLRELCGVTQTSGPNDFAVALYQQLRLRSGNLFISPFSVRSALGIAYAGAAGETRAQMSTALGAGSSAELVRRITTTHGQYEMSVAASLWSQEGAPLQAPFITEIERQYGRAVYLADFERDADTARITINQWVEDTTRRRIRELIPADGLSHDTRLVLVNAAYFKGRWIVPFDAADTRDQPFYFLGGGYVRAPLMHSSHHVYYAQADGYQAVALPYQGAELAMVLLLPDRRNGLPDLEEQLSGRLVRDLAVAMERRVVSLTLPRFTITWGTANLRDQLAALGMPLAFTRSAADFSGINGLKPPHRDALWIGDVYHKAFVEVNEAGSEAAATTAVAMTLAMSSYGGPPRPTLTVRADHPFLFAICDRETHTVLFLGRVTNPVGEH